MDAASYSYVFLAGTAQTYEYDEAHTGSAPIPPFPRRFFPDEKSAASYEPASASYSSAPIPPFPPGFFPDEKLAASYEPASAEYSFAQFIQELVKN